MWHFVILCIARSFYVDIILQIVLIAINTRKLSQNLEYVKECKFITTFIFYSNTDVRFTFYTIPHFSYLQDEPDCYNGLCENGGTCIEGIGSFRCNCSVGYTGDTCGIGRFFVGRGSTSQVQSNMYTENVVQNILHLHRINVEC